MSKPKKQTHFNQVFDEALDQEVVEVHLVPQQSADVLRLHLRLPVLHDDVRPVMKVALDLGQVSNSDKTEALGQWLEPQMGVRNEASDFIINGGKKSFLDNPGSNLLTCF